MNINDSIKLLGLEKNSEMIEHYEKVLFQPITDLMGRKGKGFRAELLDISYQLAGKDAAQRVPSGKKRKRCERVAKVVEYLHAGSMIIDDIEDSSKYRRGEPTIHIKYGVSVALNAGNWLYFWAINEVSNLGLSRETENQMLRMLNQILLEAHFGQAIDVGVPIDTVSKESIPRLVESSIEAKSGALVDLSFGLGGILGGATPERLMVLRKLGRKIGMALQMFDDIKNVKNGYLISDPVFNRNKYEDLHLRRPTWIWSYVAKNSSEESFSRFVQSVKKLPDDSFLRYWINENNLFEKAKADALSFLTSSINEAKREIGSQEKFSEVYDLLDQFAIRLSGAYD